MGWWCRSVPGQGSHCNFSGNQDPAALAHPGPFPSSAPALCCSLQAWGGGQQKLACLGTQQVTNQKRVRLYWMAAGSWLKWPDSQGHRGQSCHWSPRLADVTGNHWGHRGPAGTWELVPQALGGTQSKPTSPPPGPPGYTSQARKQYSGHLHLPEPPWKATPHPVPHFLSECMWSPHCQPKIRGYGAILGVAR